MHCDCRSTHGQCGIACLPLPRFAGSSPGFSLLQWPAKKLPRRCCALPAAPQVDTGGRGVVALCGPTGRGILVMGSADGTVSLLDPRRCASHLLQPCDITPLVCTALDSSSCSPAPPPHPPPLPQRVQGGAQPAGARGRLCCAGRPGRPGGHLRLRQPHGPPQPGVVRQGVRLGVDTTGLGDLARRGAPRKVGSCCGFTAPGVREWRPCPAAV